MIWVGVVIIIGQSVMVGVLLMLVRTFGAYATALITAHESNMIVYQQSIKVLEYAEQKLKENAA